MRTLLREYVRLKLKTLIVETLTQKGITVSGSALKFVGPDEGSEENDNLLVEPDDPEEQEEAVEASVAAAVAGVTVPMGAGPTYPNRPKKRTRKKKSK